MTAKHRLETCRNEQKIDREISDVLIAISVVARRLAYRIEKLNEGGVRNE